MRRTAFFSALLFGVVALAAPPPVAAQDVNGGPGADGQASPLVMPPPGQQAPDGFGPGGGYTAFQAARWIWFSGSDSPVHYSDGYIGPAGTNQADYWTQLDLPNGAAIDYVYAVVYDFDADGYWSFSFKGYEGAPFEGTPHVVTFQSGSTSGPDQPGYTAITLNVSPPVVVHEWADLYGDGTPNVVSYNLELEALPSSLDTLAFWGAAVHWTRTISPAPATATFPDVPTNFWAFQDIEALAASGITQGQPDGNFHPTDPVTRAQMATFLARALGLEWTE